MSDLILPSQGTTRTHPVAELEVGDLSPPSQSVAEKNFAEKPEGESWPTIGVDIIVHSLSADDSAGRDFRITSKSQLVDFLHRLSLQDVPSSQNLLLVEDISAEVIRELTNSLEIPTDAFQHHMNGRLNSDNIRQEASVLHAQKMSSTLLGRTSASKDNYSLTWWKLLTHSLPGYTYEREALTKSDADATKVVVPDFGVNISDTRRKVGFSKISTTQEKSGFKKFVRQLKKGQNEAGINWRFDGKKQEVERREETICKLYCNTYRPHQVISEVKNEIWGSAAEVRLTYIKASRRGSVFYVFLFDKDRTLQEYTQTSEIDYTSARSYGIFNNFLRDKIRKPTTRLIAEQRGALVPTFLTSAEAHMRIAVIFRKRGRNTVGKFDVTSMPKFDESTRHRFLKNISQQGLLNWRNVQRGGDFPILNIQLAFVRIMTEDWDLVLSQMAQTLDDIDRKMSDNSELEQNVLPWRRLLGSWRMTIIEYRAKLSETDHFIRSQMRQPVQATGSILSEANSGRNPSADEDSLHTITRPIESELEDILSSFKILGDGIKEIESRVERSFLALMSSMSIIESQKAIVQGSAVARLTELAFVFIPLNFACTFFSMQISNFSNDHQPSLGSFFALAVPLMIFLYSLRAFIRSPLLHDMTHRLEAKIRETSKIPGTSEIPTRVIISFGWQQLGSFPRALLLVVPLALTVLVLIIKLGEWRAFRIAGSIVTVLGTLIIVIFLAIESYVPALQAFAIVAWLISMLGIGLGRIKPLNSAVMASLCTIVTTVFLIALAFIPQTVRISKNPRQRAGEILLPLWLIELPIAIICHYYKISSPQWEVWVLLIALFSVFILFGIVVTAIDLEVYKPLAQMIALAAFSIGFPMAMVWSYAPEHGGHLPLYGAIIILFASIIVFLEVSRYFEDLFDSQFLDVSPAHGIFFAVLCVLVAVPITLVWDTLPSSNITVPLYAQISVTCGSTFLFATFITLIPPFSRNLSFLALSLYLGSTAAWLPALLWAGHIHAFKRLTDNRTNTIHVTWTSILFWTMVWGAVALKVRKQVGHSSIQRYYWE